jgi:hypothetical protein
MPLFETGEYFFHQKLYQDLLTATVEKTVSSTDMKEFTPITSTSSVKAGSRGTTTRAATAMSANARVASTRVVYPTIIPTGTPFGASYDRVEPSGW